MVTEAPDAWAVRVPPGYRVGRWRVVSGIATGSWGSVYAARRTTTRRTATDRRVSGAAELPARAARKFLPAGTLTPRHLRHVADMARREQRARSLPEHPGLVRTYEMLTVTDPGDPELDGCVVLVMELATDTVQTLLDRCPGRPVPRAPRMVAELADTLAHLHAAGWVHGDVKPANVLVMPDGSTRLTDFGLTAELEGTHGYLPPVGSIDHTPPEAQAETLSVRGRAVRTTADTWAFGVTAFQLLTGGLPFPGSTSRARFAAATEYAAGRGELTSLTALPTGWRELVADCLERDPARRGATAMATVAARARTLAMPRRPRRRRRGLRRASPALATACLFVALGAAATLVERPGWLPGLPEEPTGQEAARGPVGVPGTGGAVPAPTAGGAPEGPSPATGTSPATPTATTPTTGTAGTVVGAGTLRTGVGIPVRYRALIVQAGTSCSLSGLSPALVAAILKVESDFDPDLADPARDEYGIARWTPRVLRYHLPPEQQASVPTPPFPPEMSVSAVGRFACRYLPELTGVPGDPGLLVAAGYQFNTERVRAVNGIPPEAGGFVARVEYYRALYDPGRTRPGTPPG